MDFTQWACKLNILKLIKSFQLKTKATISILSGLGTRRNVCCWNIVDTNLNFSCVQASHLYLNHFHPHHHHHKPFIHTTNNQSLCMFYSILESGAVFIWNAIASFHEVSEVLIVLSPGVLISAWSMCPSFLLLRLERSVSHRCSCVDPMSTRGWQLIFIKAAVGEAETWGHLKGMHLASLKILCYLSFGLTGWWYGLAQIHKLCSNSEIFHLLYSLTMCIQKQRFLSFHSLYLSPSPVF